MRVIFYEVANAVILRKVIMFFFQISDTVISFAADLLLQIGSQ